MFRLYYLLTTIMICLLLGLSTSADAESPESKQNFRNAATWYKVARATENGYQAHERAQQLYQAVIEDPQASSELKEKAQLGLDQAVFRLDNAHDTYRTLFDPVWWMTRADTTIEWYDDPYMLALGNAYRSVEAHWEREMDPENHAVLVLVSRDPDLGRMLDSDGQTDAEEEELYRLQLMRDEIIGFADSTPSIVGVPDDRVPLSLDWTGNTIVTPEHIAEVTEKMKTQGVVVFKARIVDEIPANEEHLAVVKVSLTTQFWRRSNQGEPYATIKSSGIGQDAASRKSTASYWLLGLLGLVLICSTVFNRIQLDADNVHPIRAVLVGGLTFLIGGVWSTLIFTFAQDYQVDWGQASLYMEHDPIQLSIPYLPSFIWVVVFGGLVLLGPMLLILWVHSNAQVVLNMLIPDRKAQIPLIVPTMMTGAMAWSFLPLVMADVNYGWQIAVPILIGVMVLSFAGLNSFIKAMFNEDINAFHTKNVILTMVSMVAVFSIGLFNDLSLVMCVLSFPLGFFVYFRKMSEEAIFNIEPKVVETSENPFQAFHLIQEEEELVTNISEHIISGVSVCVERGGLTAASRVLSSTYEKVINQNTSDESKVFYIRCNSTDEEPFAFTNRLFEIFGFQSRMGSTEQEGNVVVDGLDMILGGLPGVDFVMGLINTGEDGMTRDVMIQDAATLIYTGTHKKVNSLVLFLENAHHIDDASREVISMVASRFMAHQSRRFILVWDDISHQDCPLVEEEVSKLQLSSCTTEQVKEFSDLYQVQDVPPDIFSEIEHLADGDIQLVQGLFAHLFDEQWLQLTSEQSIIPSSRLTSGSLSQALPNTYRDVELAKIEPFDPIEQQILKCASVCGDLVYAQELHTALELPTQHLLIHLNTIETAVNPCIIQDLPNEPFIFQFRLSLTRVVFQDFLHYSQQDGQLGGPNELACHYHKRIVDSAIAGTLSQVPLSRQVEHAIALGVRAYEELLILLGRYVEELYQKRAWPEIINVYEEHSLKMRKFMDRFDHVKMELYYARALKNTPERTHIEAVNFLSETAMRSSNLNEQESFYVLREWCDISYANAFSNDVVNGFSQDLVNVLPSLNGISRAYVESYRLTVEKRLNKVEIWQSLNELVQELKRLPSTPEQEYALGRIIKEMAWDKWKCWFHDDVQESMKKSDRSAFDPIAQEHYHSNIQPLFEEANRYMLTQEDYSGLAVSYGQQGSIFLLDLFQYDKAEDMYAKDLTVVQEHHFVGVESATLNRLSTSMLKSITHQWADASEKDQRLLEALNLANEAVELGIKLKQTANIAFATRQVVDVIATIHHQSVNPSLNGFSDKLTIVLEQVEMIEWTQIGFDYPKVQWIQVCDSYPKEEWSVELKAKIQASMTK